MTAPSNAELKTLLLDHYHCTFFLPLIGLPDEFKPEASRKTYPAGSASSECDAQAFHFFTPILRNILFDRGTEDTEHSPQTLTPMREWYLPQEVIQLWRMTLHKADGDKNITPLTQQTALFQSVQLFRYFNGIYVLAFTVTPEVLPPLQERVKQKRDELAEAEKQIPVEERKPAWELDKEADATVSLFAGSIQKLADVSPYDPDRDVYPKLQLEAWLRFSRLGRQLYRSFTEQGDESKIAKLCLNSVTGETLKTAFDESMKKLEMPEHPGKDLSPIIIFLLQQFFKPQAAALETWLKQNIALYDDRMFISVAYGLAGKQHTDETLHKINTLAGFTDRVADCWVEDYPYTAEVTDRYLQGKCFDLWKAVGSNYFYTDRVNAYVSNGGFFRRSIATCHIPHLYNRMLVQALFYQASLRHYDHKMIETTLTLLKDQDKIKLIKEQLEAFIRFTNQYWFPELTDQMQGKEIFRLQQQGLNLQVHYERIKEKISRTDEYLNAQREAHSSDLSNALSQLSTKLTHWGAAFALGALYLAVLPVLNDMVKDFNTPSLSLWQWGAKHLHEGGMTLLVALPLVALISWAWIKRPKP